MRPCHRFVSGVALLLWTNAVLADAPQPAVHFMAGGSDTTIPIAAAVAGDAGGWQLNLFGRTLAQLTLKKGAVWFQAPEVRAVTHLTLSLVGHDTAPVAELFVYPKNHSLSWNGKFPLQVATPCPAWITQWLGASGLPFEVVDSTQLKTEDQSPGVLIVAGAAAGETVGEFDSRYRGAGRNVLLLSAPWFGEEIRQPAVSERIVATDLTGPLARRVSQRWSRPVVFPARQQPFAGIVNRRPFIRGQSDPLVEELGTDWKQGTVIASYVPWPRQLGRNELADQLLFDLLVAVAGYRSPAIRESRVRFIAPDLDAVDAASRPVLAAAAGHQPAAVDGAGVDVVDLRGPDVAEVSVETVLRLIRRPSGNSHVLVLGHDSQERVSHAIRHTRKKSSIPTADLTWIPSDRLPRSVAEQVRLMEVLTEVGVPLGVLSSTGVTK